MKACISVLRGRSRPGTLKRGAKFHPVCERIVRIIADMFYGFTNVRVHIFDIR